MALLEARNLAVHYETVEGVVKAVGGINLTLESKEILGIAGESGCGKSTLAYSLINLIPPPGKIYEGEILLEGEDILKKSHSELRRIRWEKISIVFQGSMNALNPIFRVGEQLKETIMIHEEITESDAGKRVRNLLDAVGVGRDRYRAYPFELSGGMQQRVVIAMALVCNPKIVIADEPTTALDVIVGTRIMKLLRDIRDKFGTSIILITHDMSRLVQLCDKIAIMYAGKIVEQANVRDILDSPLHPYTRALLSSVITIDRAEKRLFGLSGSPPDLIELPPGCSFNPRCPSVTDACKMKTPSLAEVSKNHFVACHQVHDN